MTCRFDDVIASVRVGALALGVLACSAAADEPDDPISGVGLITLMPGVDIADILADFPSLVSGVVDSIPSRQVYLLQIAQGVTEDQFELVIETDPRILRAELDFVSGDPGPGAQDFWIGSSLRQFESQTIIVELGLGAAHSLSTGAGTVVAIVDTGLDAAHPGLSSATVLPGFNFVDGTTDTSDVGNGLDDDGDLLIDEMVGHGTFVAGLVNLVAPDAALLPVRVIEGDGHSTAFLLAKGIYFAIDQGADVINISMGADVEVPVVEDAVDEAVDAGIIVVASAGNDSREVPPLYPSAFNKVVATCAVDFGDVLAPFSNFGDHVVVSAPGVDLVSLIPGGGFGSASGTSFSAPLLSGTAALVKSIGSVRRWAHFKKMLKDTTIDVSTLNPAFDGLMGFGRLDVAAAASWNGCLADLDGDGAVDIGDFFTFVGAFAGGDLLADVNDDDTVDVRDFFEFIVLYMQGC